MIIGITGKSGSGKSYFAKQISLADENFIYIDADKFMHKCFMGNFFSITQKKDARYKNLIAYSSDLLNIVISNKLLVKIFEKIILKKFNEVKKKHYGKNIIFDSFLLPLSNDFIEYCDVKIFVDASYKTREKRLLERDYLLTSSYQKREKYSPNYRKINYDLEINTDNITQEETMKFVQQVVNLIENKKQLELKIQKNCSEKI